MESFLPGWFERQEQLIAELAGAPRENTDLLRRLINRALAHYHEYYEVKADVASRDVLGIFYPTWLTPYEQTFLWVAGWKPSMAFRLLRSAVDGMSPDQDRAVDELRRQTALSERELSEELARVQEAVAMPEVLGFFRGAHSGQARAAAVNELVGNLQRLVAEADGLRSRTVNSLAGILGTAQTVDFLAASCELRLSIRRWGARRAGWPG